MATTSTAPTAGKNQDGSRAKGLPLPFKILFGMYAAMMPFLVPAFAGVDVPMWLGLEWHRALHVLGAVMMVGNVFITAAWMAAAMQTKSPALLRFGGRIVPWMDVFFTGPGFFLLAVNGVSMATAWGGMYRWSWLVVSLVLLGLTGVTAVALIPVQIKIYRICEVQSDEPLPPELDQLLKRWNNWGSPAALIPLVIMFLMLVKPRFW
ncbi:MAG: DUF2269 family protein [Deltaproteobacteria bacterium]|nr:DUF2269 family protein [Deltaproteobacteria bacterium]